MLLKRRNGLGGINKDQTMSSMHIYNHITHQQSNTTKSQIKSTTPKHHKKMITYVERKDNNNNNNPQHNFNRQVHRKERRTIKHARRVSILGGTSMEDRAQESSIQALYYSSGVISLSNFKDNIKGNNG